MTAPVRMTLKDMAEQLGVSATTVSRVLSGQARQYRISKKTEAAVRRLAAEANFSPNRVARGLRLNKTESIGVVIPDVSNPFFAGIVRQIALGARNCGYSVIVCDSQETEDLEIESLDLLRGAAWKESCFAQWGVQRSIWFGSKRVICPSCWRIATSPACDYPLWLRIILGCAGGDGPPDSQRPPANRLFAGFGGNVAQ